MLQAKDAALSAKNYLADTMGELPGFVLDEVEKVGDNWLVTVSFYENIFATYKVHKVLTIDAGTGNVVSMKNKNGQ